MAQIPELITGCDDHFDTSLTPEDMKILTDIGLNAIKLPVYGADIGSDEVPFFQKKGDREKFDFSQVDERLELLAQYQVVPIICPHKGSWWGAGFIIDDLMYEDTKRHVRFVTEHIHKNFGPVIYGFFEIETAGRHLHQYGNFASYYYQCSKSFRGSYLRGLRGIYGRIEELNVVYGKSYRSFDECPVPYLGRVPLEIDPGHARGHFPIAGKEKPEFPEDSIENIIYYDLKRIISKLSAERYNKIGETIKEISPGSEYWGPCPQLEFMFDTRQLHSNTSLSAIGPTLCDLAKQPHIDCLHVDTYRETVFLAAAEWRIAAKAAKKYGKRLVIGEVGGENGDKFIQALDSVTYGADNLRGVLIWDAKSGGPNQEAEAFGILNLKGKPRHPWYEQAQKFFSTLQKGAKFYSEYHRGDVEVYFPHHSLNVIQDGKMPFKKTIQLMADLLEAGYKPEPIFDDEVEKGEFSKLWVYSYYMSCQAMKAIKKFRETENKKYVVWQYAGHSSGKAKGKDFEEIWPEILSFEASQSGPKPKERCKVLDSYLSPPELSLCYPPFWDIEDAGENKIVARHSSLYDNKILGIKTGKESYWFDEYPGFKDYFGERRLIKVLEDPKLTYEPAPFGHRQSAHYALQYFNGKDELLIIAINLLRTANPIKIIVHLKEIGCDVQKQYRVENLSLDKLLVNKVSPDSSGALSFSSLIPGNEKYLFLITRAV